ncbi:hypothetical protein Btru_067435 [Bulinus truncatus]|nr:hypothetical protein Btru_067435 [Bulinus truncatus]
MPCGHSLCMPCYQQTVEKANLTCPICRKRISVWARRSAKNNTLIDQKKWAVIQKAFPQKVKLRMEGGEISDCDSDDDDNFETDLRRLKELSNPGEIRKEYEAALEKLRQQREEEARKEEEASRALIEAIQKEEQLELARMKEMEEIEKSDRLKALEIEKELQLHKLSMKKSQQHTADKESSKKRHHKKSTQNKSLTLPVTLNKFYVSVPRLALSPLPLPEQDSDDSSDTEIRKKPSTDLPPGLADFCWAQVDENLEKNVPNSTKQDSVHKSDLYKAGPSGLSFLAKNISSTHCDNFHNSTVDYQPVVVCEKNKDLDNLFDKAGSVTLDSHFHDGSVKESVSRQLVEVSIHEVNTDVDSTIIADKTCEIALSDNFSQYNAPPVLDSSKSSTNINTNHKTHITSQSLTQKDSSVKQWFVRDSKNLANFGDDSLRLTVSDKKILAKPGEDCIKLPGCDNTIKQPGHEYEKGTLDGFIKKMKRDGGDCGEPCNKKLKLLDSDDSQLTQLEKDRLLAIKLQETFDLLDKKKISVDRFEGSGGEYSLRRKRKRNQ